MKDSLVDKSMLFTSFFLCKEKKTEPGLHLQQEGKQALNPQKIDKKTLFVKWTAKYVFSSHMCSYKNSGVSELA